MVQSFANWRKIDISMSIKTCIFSRLRLALELPVNDDDLVSREALMLRIERSANGKVVLTLSGRMNAENVDELKKLLQSEAKDRRIVLDLRDLTLVDRDVVKFLERCEADSIRLKNCPAYIREWILRERNAG